MQEKENVCTNQPCFGARGSRVSSKRSVRVTVGENQRRTYSQSIAVNGWWRTGGALLSFFSKTHRSHCWQNERESLAAFCPLLKADRGAAVYTRNSAPANARSLEKVDSRLFSHFSAVKGLRSFLFFFIIINQDQTHTRVLCTD